MSKLFEVVRLLENFFGHILYQTIKYFSCTLNSSIKEFKYYVCNRRQKHYQIRSATQYAMNNYTRRNRVSAMLFRDG